MSGFVFDVKAARAAIAARRIEHCKLAVPAVLAANGAASRAEPQQPQKPQQPQQCANDYADEIQERAALAADRVPPCYLDAWARLQCQRPSYAPEEARRQAIEDAGQFLDTWGALAAELGWSAGELFDVPRGGRPGGVVWQLKGARVEALGADHARLSDGRIILRTEVSR